MEQQEVIKMVNITKTFGDVIANHNVNLSLHKGEIHAILGENGAGKSTLMNMLSGIYTPDSGSIFIRGKETRFRSPMDPIELGIGMIHQHFKLVNVFTALDNIIAGEKGKPILVRKKLKKEIKQITQSIGLEVDLGKRIYDMSVSEKQAVEIVKVLYRGGEILILDEPTAVLTPQETKKLFAILHKMKARGCTIVIITHKLHEVMEISDKVTILRKGETVATVNTGDTTPKELTDLMVGQTTDLKIERKSVKQKEVILEAREICVENVEKIKVLKQISFTLFRGEILGVAGVAGSGQKELCEALAGLVPITSGKIEYNNQSTERINIGFVPEDRLGMGLIPSMDLIDNLLLRKYKKEHKFIVKRKPIAKKAHDLVETLQIQCPGIDHAIKVLSGGNIQKVLIGREIDSNPDVLITAYPVRGLDVGASHTIYDLLNQRKENGGGVFFVGEDLDVLMALCDRIMVMCNGEITGIVSAEKITKEELGLMMAGEALAEEQWMKDYTKKEEKNYA